MAVSQARVKTRKGSVKYLKKCDKDQRQKSRGIVPQPPAAPFRSFRHIQPNG
jgi:hypothetical protein